MSAYFGRGFSYSHVGGVAIKDGCVTSTDLTWVVENDDLGVERGGLHGRVVLGVGRDVPSANVFDGHILNVETDVISFVT